MNVLHFRFLFEYVISYCHHLSRIFTFVNYFEMSIQNTYSVDHQRFIVQKTDSDYA